MRVKSIQTNFIVTENEVGILSKVCLNCLKETENFRQLTDDVCWECQSYFKKGQLTLKYEINFIHWQTQEIKKFTQQFLKGLQQGDVI